MIMFLIILFIFILIVAITIYLDWNSDKICLYKTFAVNPIIDGKVDNTQSLIVEFKKNILSIKSGVTQKQILFSAHISNCDMLFEREYTPKEIEVVEPDKSVIGRAIVGGALLGPVGAVVGGMSGIGTNKNIKVIKQEKNDIYVTISSDNKNFLYKVAAYNNEAANAIYRYFFAIKRKQVSRLG